MDEPTGENSTPQAGSGENLDGIRYHKTMLRVPLFEVDLGQAVYHGNYFHLFELAREDFLRHIGFPYREFMDRKLHLTIVEASCTYRKPLHYDDAIEIETGITLVRHRSVSFSQIIHRRKEESGKELCTRALLKTVCVTFSGQPVRLPEDFRAILSTRLAGK
ncbi:MAG: acyl-CoA thioesterase [Desulfobacteraceae bacterium]|nr:acyl-CoA thioesterase [Desulfobacteraceae bacterium]